MSIGADQRYKSSLPTFLFARLEKEYVGSVGSFSMRKVDGDSLKQYEEICRVIFACSVFAASRKQLYQIPIASLYSWLLMSSIGK